MTKNLIKHLKSRTQLFNGLMLTIDALVANAAFMQELMTIQEFASTILFLKVVQSLGNFYLRSITKEAISDK